MQLLLVATIYKILFSKLLSRSSLSEWACWPFYEGLCKTGEDGLECELGSSSQTTVSRSLRVSRHTRAGPLWPFPTSLLLSLSWRSNLARIWMEERSFCSPLFSIGGVHVGVFRSWKEKSPVGPVWRGTSWNSTRKRGKDEPKVSWWTGGLFSSFWNC